MIKTKTTTTTITTSTTTTTTTATTTTTEWKPPEISGGLPSRPEGPSIIPAIGKLTGNDYQSFRRWLSSLLRANGELHARWEAALEASTAKGGLLAWLWADVKDSVITMSFRGWLDDQEQNLQHTFAWMGADGAEQVLLQGFEEIFVPALKEAVNAEYCALRLPNLYGPNGQLPLLRNRPAWHKWSGAASSLLQQGMLPAEMPNDFKDFWEDSMVRMLLPAFDSAVKGFKGHVLQFFTNEVLEPAFSDTLMQAQRDDKLWDAYHKGGKKLALPLVLTKLDAWWQETVKEEERPSWLKNLCRAVEFVVVNQ